MECDNVNGLFPEYNVLCKNLFGVIAMQETFSYDGVRSAIHYSTEDQTFHGKVAGITDLVTFEAPTIAELETAFREAVSDYLAMRKRI